MTNQYTPMAGKKEDSPVKIKEPNNYDVQMVTMAPPPSKVILNVPSDTYLVPVEGILSPIESENKGSILQQEKFKLRSPMKATQEEIDLTKRYIGVREQLKQSKVIRNSVIKGRKYTGGKESTSPSKMTKDINFSNLTIRNDDPHQNSNNQMKL